MSYKLTLRRRREDASLEELILNCELESAQVNNQGLTEEEVAYLILDAEMQANGEMLQSPRPTVRVWINED